MKICIAQQNYHIGNFEQNTHKILCAIEEAKKQGADLILFSEMSVCGYPARDFVEFEDFIAKCYESIEQIKAAADTIGVLIGSPARNPNKKGKDLFNAAFFLYEQKVIAEIHKTLLPTYDVFDENRYFEPADDWKVVSFKGKKLAVTICEDIWNLGDNPLYRICPMDKMMDQHPDILLNLSASPFDYTHDEDRKATIKSNVLKYKIPLFYCNAIGSQTEIVFDGSSLVFDKDANLCGALPMFESALAVFDCADAKVAKAVKKLIKKNLPDTLIYKKINAKDPLAVTITRGKYEKGQNEIVDKLVWEEGITDLPPNGKKQSFVKIYEVMQPTPKELSEIMGVATSDYQAYLEENWIKELKGKYPVAINTDGVNRLFK